MGVIKFLRDVSGLFNWNTDDNPTSEQDYMNAVKNWQETEKNLVDTILWQPLTNYSLGNIVRTPSLPSQYCLECVAFENDGTSGTSGANEPVYSNPKEYDRVWDGSVLWEVKKYVGSVTVYDNVTSTQQVSENEWTDTAIDAGSAGKYIVIGRAVFKTGSTATGFRSIRIKRESYVGDTVKTNTYIGTTGAGCATNEILTTCNVIDIPSDADTCLLTLQVYSSVSCEATGYIRLIRL